MRSMARSSFAFLTGLVMTASLAAGHSAQAAEWRGWNIHPPGYPVTVAMESFAKNIEKATDGRIKAKVYNSGVLGDQPDAIQQVRVGGIDFAVFNLGPMGQVVPTVDVVSLPFIFKDLDHMHKVMDGPIGDELAAAMADKGLVALGWYDSGARSFYNTKKPIKEPSDVKGMKLRVMNNDLFVNMVEALGGNATPMAYGEVYQSLKTGVIDGAENNWPSYKSSNHYEVAGYYSDTEHLIIPECFCVNKKLWDGLPDADKALVKTAARDSATLQRKLWAERAEASRKKVEAAGVKFNEVTDKAAFQKAMEPVYTKFITSHPALKGLIEKIKAAQ